MVAGNFPVRFHLHSLPLHTHLFFSPPSEHPHNPDVTNTTFHLISCSTDLIQIQPPPAKHLKFNFNLFSPNSCFLPFQLHSLLNTPQIIKLKCACKASDLCFFKDIFSQKKAKTEILKKRLKP